MSYVNSNYQTKYPLIGELSGQLFRRNDENPLRCLALEISGVNLKIQTYEPLAIGSLLILSINANQVPMTVDCDVPLEGGKKGSYGYQLISQETIELKDVFNLNSPSYELWEVGEAI